MDLAIAIPASLASFPLVVVLAIGPAVLFRAWPFFTQQRRGQHGTLFTFVKIRSLPTAAVPDPRTKRGTLTPNCDDSMGKSSMQGTVSGYIGVTSNRSHHRDHRHPQCD